MFCRFSPFEQLDQGRQFESTVMKETCDIFKINKTRTLAFHTQCDRLVEMFNHTLLSVCYQRPQRIIHLIGKIKFVRFVLASVNPLTGYTPQFFSCL